MIGRADIKGSKSNVAMNAWLSQASYPCGNFSDTSSFKFRRSKGSIGHAFTVLIRTGNQNQTSFYPFVPHEISVLVELILGYLRYLLTDVPPQPNAPLTIRIPLVRTSSESAVRRPGKAPKVAVPSTSPGRHVTTRSRRGSSSSSPPIADGFGTGTPVPNPQSQSFSRSYGSILPTSLAYIVPSTRGCSPWRPDAVMSTTRRGRHSVLRTFKGRRGRTGHHATCGALPAAGPYLRLSRFQGGPPPTSPDSLTLPSTATSRFRNFNPIPFRGSRDGSTKQCASAVHMEPFPSSAFKVLYLIFATTTKICTDGRSPQARARGFAAAAAPSYSSRTGCCPDGRPARGIPPIRFLAPYGFGRPLTRTHVRLLSPCFKTGRMGSPLADAKSAQVPRGHVQTNNPRAGSSARARNRPATSVDRRQVEAAGLARPSRALTTGGASPAPIHFPPDNFKHSLTLFSKSFSSFPRGACSLSVSRHYLALDGIYRPISAAFPNNPTRRQGSQSEQGLRSRRRLPAGVLFRAWASDTTSSHAGPGRAEPPLVVPECPWGKVFFSQPRQGGQGRPICSPPTTRRTARGGAAGHGVGGEHVGRDAQAVSHFATFFIDREPRYPLPRVVLGYRVLRSDAMARPWGPPRFLFKLGTDRAERLLGVFAPGPSGAADAEPVGAGREREARGFDGRFAPGRAPVAAGHRVLLIRLGHARFVESTMILPQVQWTSRNVIGGEPPTSPRSEHFTGPFNRQIAPPTKNGHAPPPIESRKSSQSLNPYYVWTCCSSFINPRISPLTMKYECPRLSLLIITPIPKANTIAPKSSGITAAAGTGLALQWILVKGFRLYSFQLPDSESLHPLRDRDASTRADASAPQHRARGFGGRAKVGQSDSIANPTKSTGTAAFTWVHEHSCVRRSEHTRRETMPGGESKRGCPIAPACTTRRHGSGGGFQRDYTSKASCPARGKTHKHRGCLRPNKAAGGLCGEGKTATTRRRLIMAETPPQACPTCTTRDAPWSATPDAPARMAKPAKRQRPAQASQDRERGAPNGPAESVKDQKLEVGQKGR
ncbi:hypothetical protein H6P81_016039 [Aristolochia fimbriata]|uniref:Senescence-associated protein n=1 Tax=Aristolochia fimbriata TaxID=158543 RepID=A0AAV7E8Y0_ARIFI|nr:hypothetical protein H6P81_016039 [Aristolochia fimbriata]